jgi:hypothetical protein
MTINKMFQIVKQIMSNTKDENSVEYDATATNSTEIDATIDDSITSDSVMVSNDESMAIDSDENRTRIRNKSRIPVAVRNEPVRVVNEPVLVGNNRSWK